MGLNIHSFAGALRQIKSIANGTLCCVRHVRECGRMFMSHETWDTIGVVYSFSCTYILFCRTQVSHSINHAYSCLNLLKITIITLIVCVIYFIFWLIFFFFLLFDPIVAVTLSVWRWLRRFVRPSSKSSVQSSSVRVSQILGSIFRSSAVDFMGAN